MDTKRVMLRVAYDGSSYHGWQIQNNAVTIEGTLREAIFDLTGEEVNLIGGSRTDAGVHALDNVAVFDTSTRIPAEKLPYALNRRLPEDICIQSAQEVAPDFHPRHCNSRKTYEYRILNTPFRIPQRRLYTNWIYGNLDVEQMSEAAACLRGEHDFTSFCSIYGQIEDHVRTIYDCRVLREGNEVALTVTGNGFLYNMVRIIAGTLIEVGKGQRPSGDIPDILEAKDRRAAGHTAPPAGLTLMRYEFS